MAAFCACAAKTGLFGIPPSGFIPPLAALASERLRRPFNPCRTASANHSVAVPYDCKIAAAPSIERNADFAVIALRAFVQRQACNILYRILRLQSF